LANSYFKPFINLPNKHLISKFINKQQLLFPLSTYPHKPLHILKSIIDTSEILIPLKNLHPKLKQDILPPLKKTLTLHLKFHGLNPYINILPLQIPLLPEPKSRIPNKTPPLKVLLLPKLKHKLIRLSSQHTPIKILPLQPSIIKHQSLILQFFPPLKVAQLLNIKVCLALYL
jgi:hypothetical protein